MVYGGSTHRSNAAKTMSGSEIAKKAKKNDVNRSCDLRIFLGIVRDHFQHVTQCVSDSLHFTQGVVALLFFHVLKVQLDVFSVSLSDRCGYVTSNSRSILVYSSLRYIQLQL